MRAAECPPRGDGEPPLGVATATSPAVSMMYTGSAGGASLALLCPPRMTSASCQGVTVWPAMGGRPCSPGSAPPPSEGLKGRVGTKVQEVVLRSSLHTSDR